MAMGMHMCFQG